MKKKILLISLMVMLFACLLIISAGATAINKDTTVTLNGSFTDANGSTVTTVKLYDNEGDALIWYLNTDGKLVSDKIASLVTVDENGVISFKDQKIFYGNQAAKGAVVVNLRDNVKVSGTEINWDGTIEHFDTAKGEGTGTDLASTGFQFGTYNYSGHSLQYFYFPTTAKSITKRMFQGAPVKVVDIEPGTPISKIGLLSFYDAKKLEEIFIPNDIQVFTSVPDQGIFQNCSSLSRVIFEENSKLWDAGHCTFHNCSSLKELYLPNSVKTVGHQFARSSGLEVISLGASFEYFTMKYDGKDPDSNHMWVFWGCGNLKKVYMPATFAILNDDYAYDDLVAGDDRLDTFDRAFESAGSFTLFFTGTVEEINKLKTRINCTDNNSSLINALKNIYSYDEYINAGSPSGSLAVYSYNACDAFYDGVHNNETEYVFTSFVNECYTQNTCKRCEKAEKGEIFKPMFKFNGYSTNGTEICVGYTINNASIKKYKEYNSEIAFSYGFVASANNNAPINEDGSFTSNTINVDLTGESYVAIDFRLTGNFSDSKYAEAEISMNLYTITEKEVDGELKPSVEYIYGYADEETNTIVTQAYGNADSVSYNDLNPKQ